jgi:hypothetical protein
VPGTYSIRASGSVKLSNGANKDVSAAICINGVPLGVPQRSLSAAAAANIAPFNCFLVRQLVFSDVVSVRLRVQGMTNGQNWIVDTMDLAIIWVAA